MAIKTIKYIKKIPGSYIIDELSNIENDIQKMIDEKDLITNNAKLVREYAKRNHDKEKNQQLLRKSFLELVNNKGE